METTIEYLGFRVVWQALCKLGLLRSFEVGRGPPNLVGAAGSQDP